MFIYRKYQRLTLYLRRHLFLIILLLIILTFILLSFKIIIYYVYIQILDIEPYKNAITFWSTDFHIRYF